MPSPIPQPTNFVELHMAWQKTLDTSELNKRFFKEVLYDLSTAERGIILDGCK